MSQHAQASPPPPPTEAGRRVVPMKARRGGISLGGKRKLSQSELFRRPGTIYLPSHSYHHHHHHHHRHRQQQQQSSQIASENAPEASTSSTAGVKTDVSTNNQPSAIVQSASLAGGFSPEPDLDDSDSLDKRAQSLLHQFLCTSSAKLMKWADSGLRSESESRNSQAQAARTADGEVKKNIFGAEVFLEGEGDIDSKKIVNSEKFHSNESLSGRAHGSQCSGVMHNSIATPAATTPRNHVNLPSKSIPPFSGISAQNHTQDLNNEHIAVLPELAGIASSSTASKIQSALSGLATTTPPSYPVPTVVVLQRPPPEVFIKPGLRASSTSLSTNPPEKHPRKKPGPKLKMARSYCSTSSFVPPECPSETSVRRPRRARAAPINYYAKRPGFYGYKDEEEGEEETRAPEPIKPPDDSHKETTLNDQLAPVPESTRPPFRSEYRSGYLQLEKSPLTEVVSNMFEKYAPYCSQDARKGYGKRCENEKLDEDDPEGQVIHVDFDQREMEGLYLTMTGKLPAESDVPLPDQLIHAARKFFPKPREQKALVGKIFYLNVIRKSLLEITDNPIALLLHLRQKNNSWRKVDKVPNVQTIMRIVSHIPLVFNLQEEQPNRVHSVRYIQQAVQRISDDEFDYLVSVLPHMDFFKFRRKQHIRAFLSDAAQGLISSTPHLLRAISSNAAYPSPDYDSMRPSALLRGRELGERVYRRKTPINRKLQMNKSLELWKHWKGASNDVVVLAWSPDGTRFAAGAAAQSDEHNMMYNRNNNLLLGDLTCNSLKELPDHRIMRPAPHNVTDPNLYMSVSAVHWRDDSLYTASYDSTVKVWDVSTHSGARCVNTLRHHGRVTVMAVSKSGTVATGCDSASHIKLWNKSEDGRDYSPFELACHPTKNVEMVPSSLTWGPFSADNFLVAGLAGRNDENYRNGYLAVWQMGEAAPVPLAVSPNSQNVFDAVWHPTERIFATGNSVPFTVSTLGLARSTRSMVRVYDPLRSRALIFYECPALDINDVTFCPANPNYITASCTDGVTYVWDYRNPGQVLHRLCHGTPILEQNTTVSREQHDTGVRMALWRNNWIDQFYTGGSDGVLKKWNILRAPEDVLVENTASFDQGIMSGAFSPDFTNLLVGDSCGSIHVISSAPFSREGGETLVYEPADKDRASEDDENLGTKTAQELLSSGKLSRHPIFGVGQGPRYDGPFAAWARAPGTPRELLPSTPLLPDVRAMQLYGPSVSTRHQLDSDGKKQLSARIRVAIAQNQLRGKNKRKGSEEAAEEAATFRSSSAHSSSSSFSRPPPPSRFSTISPSLFVSHRYADHTHQFISMLSDDDEPGPSVSYASSSSSSIRSSSRSTAAVRIRSKLPSTSASAIDLTICSEDHEVEKLCELMEDDYWWPRSCDVDPNIRAE
ncbi:uncharacterized protein PADG_08344 [Paracoccidioides brasiliensis Pb18]|uniref:Uncharacterized protein n=1 Tax=Paracoccidioides brasiliensis (strain Pb18) TaxID=502780 RepID=C1GLV3_PARBD|nr:uncharacterized protein PADG_08344 [Paracoccidioides brasiliensis Pb18]EEH43419.2 hypothetical protein PADG_08344 [Paracoccidioides brasiliensis Pb18]